MSGLGRNGLVVYRITLDYWRKNEDRLLAFNEKAVLSHAGRVSRDEMEKIVGERFVTFDEIRRHAEAKQAEELADLEKIEKNLSKKSPGNE